MADGSRAWEGRVIAAVAIEIPLDENDRPVGIRASRGREADSKRGGSSVGLAEALAVGDPEGPMRTSLRTARASANSPSLSVARNLRGRFPPCRRRATWSRSMET